MVQVDVHDDRYKDPTDNLKNKMKDTTDKAYHVRDETKHRASAVAEKSAASLAHVSSKLDPSPHYIMGGACLLASGYAYLKMANPQAAVISAVLGGSYVLAGSWITNGSEKAGYDLSSATSIALVAATAPIAHRTGEVYSTILASLGGVSTIGNLLKSYQVRSGHPQEYKRY